MLQMITVLTLSGEEQLPLEISYEPDANGYEHKMVLSTEYKRFHTGRDNAVNVDTTRKQIYPHSTREHICYTNWDLTS